MRRLRQERGESILELVVGMAILSSILLVMSDVMRASSYATRKTDRLQEVQAEADRIINAIETDLRAAGRETLVIEESPPSLEFTRYVEIEGAPPELVPEDNPTIYALVNGEFQRTQSAITKTISRRITTFEVELISAYALRLHVIATMDDIDRDEQGNPLQVTAERETVALIGSD